MPKLLTQGVSLEPKTGRQLIGIVAGFKSERWPVIDRNAGRLQLGIRRHQIVHEEVLARVQEIDVLPNTPKSSSDPLYLLQQSGSRFALQISHDSSGNEIPPNIDNAFSTGPLPRQDGFEWRIPLSAQLPQRDVVIRTLKADHVEPLKTVLADPSLPKPKKGLPPAVDGLCPVTLAWTHKPTVARWDAVLAALKTIGDSPEASALAEAAKKLGDNESLTLQLGTLSAVEKDVEKALTALSGVKPQIGDVQWLILRRPTDDTELSFFAKHGPDGATPAGELTVWVQALATEQLFGTDRRPSVTVSKGREIPVTTAFLRRNGV